MVLPYENFYWAKIDLETRYGRHRYAVAVHPNMAKVIDISKGETINIFTGEDRKSKAVADAIDRLKHWDRHIYCCWMPKPATS